MRLGSFLSLAAVVASTVAFQAKADIVVPVPGFPTSQFISGWEAKMDASGTPPVTGPTGSTGPGGFWDNKSDDDTAQGSCNIGFLLAAATPLANCKNVNGAFGPDVPLGSGIYEYLADTSVGTGLGNSPANGVPTGWYITNPDGQPSTSSTILHVEVAGLPAVSSFGYYINGAGGATLFGANTTGVTGGSANITVNTGEKLSFWYNVNGNVYVTDGFGRNRFALFRRNPTGATNNGLVNYVIGMEDGVDWDYQDMIVSVTVVPEPATTFGLVSAVGATLLYVRRRRNRA